MRDSFMVAILFVISITGIISNAGACRTIYVTRYMHNAFGVFCTILAIANFVVMLIFFFFMALPIYKIFGDQIFNALPGKIVGQLALFCLYIDYYSHVVISFNRLLHVAFPLTGWKFFTTRVTIALSALIYTFAFLQITPYFSPDQCYFTYDVNGSYWNFADTECGRFCTSYIERPSSIICFSLILVMDSVAFFLFRKHRMLAISNGDKNRTIERRLFIQSIFQVVPMFCAILTFQLISVGQYSDWGIFLSNTFTWGLIHAMDGIVLVAFHSSLLRRITRRLKLIAPSQSSTADLRNNRGVQDTATTVQTTRGSSRFERAAGNRA